MGFNPQSSPTNITSLQAVCMLASSQVYLCVCVDCMYRLRCAPLFWVQELSEFRWTSKLAVLLPKGDVVSLDIPCAFIGLSVTVCATG